MELTATPPIDPSALASAERNQLSPPSERRMKQLLDLLARQVSLPGRNAVVLGDGDGPRPLPAALRVKAALTLADELLRGPERRLRALVAGLDAVVLKERVWAEADPRGEWRRDVDVPADLAEAEVL